MQCVTSEDLETNNVTCDEVTLTLGVPQGLVLSPLLHTLYLGPLGDLCQSHGIDFQMYVDNQQIYMSFKPSRTSRMSQEKCVFVKEDCIADIRRWMNINLLKPNDSKTEFIVIGNRQQLNKIDHISI